MREFGMIQNWNKEYPELKPYQVLEFIEKSKHQYSRCDEYGITDWLPTDAKEMWFLPASDEVLKAFLGKKIKHHNGNTFLIVTERQSNTDVNSDQ